MRLIGRLAGLYIASAKGAAMQPLPRAVAEAGRGLIGDRYHAGTGTFSRRAPLVPGARALSILDTQTLTICRERLNRKPGCKHPLADIDAARLRRNLLIDGEMLYALIGRELIVGEVRVALAGRCPPCGYLARLLDADMQTALRGLGGMRAAIVTGGSLGINDEVWLVGA